LTRVRLGVLDDVDIARPVLNSFRPCSTVIATLDRDRRVLHALRPELRPEFLPLIGPVRVMEKSAFFENFQARINKMLEETPAADLRNNLRALLQQGFEHFDLATREQLDLQTELLSRAQTRISDLEARIAKLESDRAGATLQDSPIT
jgi:ubiquinone biosynthesis accessory factor UbiK